MCLFPFFYVKSGWHKVFIEYKFHFLCFKTNRSISKFLFAQGKCYFIDVGNNVGMFTGSIFNDFLHFFIGIAPVAMHNCFAEPLR